MDQQTRISPGDFYTDQVLPALAEQLDQAFPEFGWRRDNRGWVATNQETTHRMLGVRADRVVAHRHAPQGFLVHGGQPILWTAYVNGGTTPRGTEFIRVVREIAQRTGIDTTPLERPVPRHRRTELLSDFFELCRQELASTTGASGRAYLERRGLPAGNIDRSGLGIVPEPTRTRHVLQAAGYTKVEIAGSSVLADSRWPGRLCGAWRNEHGRIGTLWARTLDDKTSPDSRYLYLRGASRTNLPPYGLSEILAAPREARHELVLVEGVIDVHQLRARGFENVAALGGTNIAPRMFERFAQLGIESVTLCLDGDRPGRMATARAVEQSGQARRSSAIFVVDPERLASAKDPDALVRDHGAEAWPNLLATRQCGIAWRVAELCAGITSESTFEARRLALSRVGSWLGTLPPRLALEQEDAIVLASERAGYSPEAVTRSFRARFWSSSPELEARRDMERAL